MTSVSEFSPWLFFPGSAWPITLGLGVGLGAGYTNCKHQMWWRHWRYHAKFEGPEGHQRPPAWGPPFWGSPWRGPQRRWEKCPIQKVRFVVKFLTHFWCSQILVYLLFFLCFILCLEAKNMHRKLSFPKKQNDGKNSL